MGKSKDMRYLLHLLCGLLCTYGLGCYFLDCWGIHSGPGPFFTLILCLGFFGIPLLLHQQWLRFPLLSAAFLSLSVLILLFDGLMQKFYLATANFALWLVPFLVSRENPGSRYVFTFAMLALAIIGLFCYLSISVFRSPLPVLLLSAAFAIVLPALLPEAKPNFFRLLPCVVGIALAMALTAKAEKEQEKFNMRLESDFFITVTAVLVSLIMIFFAAGIAVADMPEQGMQSIPVVASLNKLTRKITSVFKNKDTAPPPSSLYDSSAFGMRGENMILGGNVALSDAMVFEVTATRDLLLKGRTYDTYYSTSWGSENNPLVMSFDLPDSTYFLFQNSPDPIQVYGADGTLSNPYPNSVLLSLFDSFRPSPDLIPPELGSALFEQCDISIKNASSLIGSSLFYPDHLVVAEFTDPLFFDEDAALFSKQLLPIGAKYEIRANVFRTDDPAFEENLLALEAYIIANPGAADDLTHKSSIMQDYLEANVPDSVIGTAILVTAGYETPLAKAFAIRNYLRDNFTYSLEVPDIPAGTEFVEFFLESKTGYCTYFASAMCMLARASDIPARFVEGFYVDIPDGETSGSSTVIVTGNSAHAWCEIYIDGIGWIPIDSTPGGGGSNVPEITPTPAPTVTPTNAPSPTPETPTPATETTSPSVTITQPSTSSSVPVTAETVFSVSPTRAPVDVIDITPPAKLSGPLLAALTAIAAVIVLAAAVFLRLTWRDRKYFEVPTSEELQAIGSPEKQLRFLWSRCLLHLRLADVRIQALETPLDFAARLENIRISGKGCAPGVYRFDLRKNAAVYEQMIYGLKTPSAGDIAAVRENCITLSLQVRTIHFSAVHYTINRMTKRLKRR